MTLTESARMQIPLPCLVLDDSGAIAQVNAEAENFFNKSERSLTGVPLWDLLPPPDAATARLWRSAQADRRAVTIGDLALAPMTLGRLLAVPHDAGLTVTLVPDADTGISPATTSTRTAVGMSQMLAHEIKNPLAGIRGAAQLLSMSLDAEGQELTALIVDECARVVSLLDQVEAFGNTLDPQRRSVNIHDVLTRARTSASLGYAEGVTFREVFDPSLPEALADPDQLQQVLLNLLKNACEAGATQITLRSYYDGAVRRDGPLPLQIEIVDNGPGLPPELADHVFAPFVSGRENGTGLGLALVSKLITQGGGLVRVDSVPGRTAFHLSLPRA